MAFDVPAIIVGAGINGLGVARSLARAKVPAWLLDTDPQRPEMHTRAARPLAVRALHGDALIEDLTALVATRFAGVRPVLLLTQEEAVKTVSQQRDRLSGLYRFTLPTAATVEALQHKHGFQCLAEQFAAPIPKLLRVRAVADLAALGTLRYPVVVKPGARDAAYSREFKKAYRADNAAAADELLRRILPVLPDVVVQEWIDGPDSNIYFCLQYIDAARRVLASFTGRKVRSWPPQVGGTASCMSAPDAHAELSALTTRFFREAGVIGIASMEYKRDAASGEFRMVEPTIGRTDYQEEIATLNGVNVPFAAYCGELGLPFPAPLPKPRARAWHVRSEDVQSAAAQQQDPKSGFGDAGAVVDALWRAGDPAPWLVQTRRHIRSAVATRIGHKRRAVPPRPVRGES
ncbi:MAG TPA: FAD-dependent oxidoreductase [Rhodanobacteraceae bacterium]